MPWPAIASGTHLHWGCIHESMLGVAGDCCLTWAYFELRQNHRQNFSDGHTIWLLLLNVVQAHCRLVRVGLVPLCFKIVDAPLLDGGCC